MSQKAREIPEILTAAVKSLIALAKDEQPAAGVILGIVQTLLNVGRFFHQLTSSVMDYSQEFSSKSLLPESALHLKSHRTVWRKVL